MNLFSFYSDNKLIALEEWQDSEQLLVCRCQTVIDTPEPFDIQDVGKRQIVCENWSAGTGNYTDLSIHLFFYILEN